MQDNTIHDSGGDLAAIETAAEVSGILDITDNHASLRTEGYLPGPHDVHVPVRLAREHGLRRGDSISGIVGPKREGVKLPPLLRVDRVNGLPPAQAKARKHFADLIPIYPQDRLRLGTEPHEMATRITDLVMPIGKGQRAQIVAPPKAGKTYWPSNTPNAWSKWAATWWCCSIR